MKTLQELQTELHGLPQVQLDPTNPESKKYYARMQKYALFLKQCILYLESNPTPAFIRSEIKRLEETINLINLRFEAWKRLPDNYNSPITKYRNDAGVPLMRSQLRTLKFILYGNS